MMTLPIPNQTVKVRNIYGNQMIAKFITTSDGNHFFDNMIDEVWQLYEVASWSNIGTDYFIDIYK